MRYSKIKADTFDHLQLEAGLLLSDFDIESAGEGNAGFSDSDILGATTGGINPVCTPTFSDFAEDVDNVPNNTMEYKHIDGYDCSISTTLLGTNADLIKLAIGAADSESAFTISSSAVGQKITPRMELEDTDFNDLWWVGDRADGGLVAIKLLNALSTGGFSLQSTKNGKGNLSITLTGHVSVTDPEAVPMEIYVIEPVTP